MRILGQNEPYWTYDFFKWLEQSTPGAESLRNAQPSAAAVAECCRIPPQYNRQTVRSSRLGNVVS